MLKSKSYEEKNISYSCPACNVDVRNVRYIYTHNDKEFKIYRCLSCSLMFARPVFIGNAEDRRMDTIEDAELFNNNFLKILYKKLIIEREISSVRKILGVGTFSLLDVGCGTGWTTSIWNDFGFKVVGVEPSNARAEIAREKHGLNVITSYFEDLEIDKKFHIIILRHVIEHFENPHETLNKLFYYLQPGGLLVIVTPNINCIGRHIFRTKWSWIIPHHCNFFSPRALYFLIQKAGFDILKSYQTPSPLWYPESFLRIFPYSKSLSNKIYNRLSLFSVLPFVPLVIIGYVIQLSDNITIIAQMKKDTKDLPRKG
jgi:SAM-dependent methyltransferase